MLLWPDPRPLALVAHAGDFEDFSDIILQAAEDDPAVDALDGVDGF
jgi:hypothetical protein